MAQVITILLPDNNPNSVKIIELANFGCKTFIIPRGRLKNIKDRKEADQPAVYFLFGDIRSTSRVNVYIGESERFFNRLSNHETSRDFWNSAVVFTSPNLDRADVKYLENKSVSLAKKLNRYEILNNIDPSENRLSETKRVIADEIFEKIKFIIQFLGFYLFEETPHETTAMEVYFLRTNNAEGRGSLLESGGFVVYKGSKARVKETPSFKNRFSSLLREKLLEDGILRLESDDQYILTNDYVFPSPSAAAATLVGYPVVGGIIGKIHRVRP